MDLTGACSSGWFLVGRPPWAAAGPLAGSGVPNTGPPILPRCSRQPGSNGVVLNVSANLPELVAIPHPAVIALLLPKRPPRQTQNLVSSFRCDILQRLQQFRHSNMRRQQQVHVVRHHHKGVKCIVVQRTLAVVDGVNDDPSNFRPAQVQRSSGGFVEQTIHRHECPARAQVSRRKNSVRRQTAMQPPGQKKRLVERVEMRKSPAIGAHRHIVRQALQKSQEFVELESRPGGRLRPRGAAPPRPTTA